MHDEYWIANLGAASEMTFSQFRTVSTFHSCKLAGVRPLCIPRSLDDATNASVVSVATLQIFFSIFYTVRYGFYLAPVSAIAFGVMLWVYVSTMRHLLHVADKAEKLFEAHTASTVAGVEHVRAFSQQAQCLGKTQQIARQLLKCTYSRLQVHLRMQFIFDTWHGCIAVFVIASALLNPHSTSVAMLGLAFVLLIGGAEMPFQIVLAVAATERQLGSISRIRGFCNDTPLEQDVAIQSHPGDSWPYAGHIDLQRATVTAE